LRKCSPGEAQSIEDNILDRGRIALHCRYVGGGVGGRIEAVGLVYPRASAAERRANEQRAVGDVASALAGAVVDCDLASEQILLECQVGGNVERPPRPLLGRDRACW